MLVCMLSFTRRLYHNGCIAFQTISSFVSWDHGKSRHFFVFVPIRHSVLDGSTFQLSPGFHQKFLYQKFAFIHCCVEAPAMNMALPCLVLYDAWRCSLFSSYNLLAPRSTYPCSKHFSCYSLVWMPGKWTSPGSNGSFLPRPPNMCLLLITLVHYSGMSKQNEWPGFRSLCIPPPLFPTHYSVSPWSMDVCFIALCKVPCVLQNRTIVTATFSVNVVWDLDVFPLPLSLLWVTALFSELAYLSNQQVTYGWALLYLGPSWVLCHKFVPNFNVQFLEKIIPARW